MLKFEVAIQEVAKRFNASLKEISEGRYSLDIPFTLPNGTSRYQYVYAWIIKGRAKGKDCLYLTSRCGVYDPQHTDMYNLLREAHLGFYSAVTISKDKLLDGSLGETVVVQASPIAEYVQTTEELATIVWEVAEVADIIEEKYFGGDKN